MPHQATPEDVLNREFLALRAAVINVAAALDRLDRAGVAQSDPRRSQICQCLKSLGEPERVEAVQMALSIPYDENWRQSYGL
jgi:hypothetical protein